MCSADLDGTEQPLEGLRGGVQLGRAQVGEPGDRPVQGVLLLAGVKRFQFVRATLLRDRAPEAHFGADFYPLNLERIAVACNSSFPLPVWFWIVAR